MAVKVMVDGMVRCNEQKTCHPNKNPVNFGDTKSILKLFKHGFSNVMFKQNVVFLL